MRALGRSGERRTPAGPQPIRRTGPARFARSAVHRFVNGVARLPRGTGLAAAIAFLSCSAAYGMVVSGRTAEVMNTATYELGFGVDEILITGQREVSEAEIIQLLDIPAGESLFTFDVEAARGRLASNPWFDDVSVLKLYPNKIEVVVSERTAFGLWQETSESPLTVIDRNGDRITTVVGARFADLPRVVGIGADKRIHEIVSLLAEYPDVQAKVRAAMLISERRWDLVLDEDILVMLPETGVEEAIEEVARLDADMHLLTRDIERVDMRLSDRMTIELTDAAKEARDELLEEIARERSRRART